MTFQQTLTLFLKTILLLFPLVANAFAAVIYLCLVGLILALFLSTGPIKLPLLLVRSGMLPLLSFESFSPPAGQLCFSEHELHITSPLLPFFHIVEFVTLHNSQTGLLPRGIVIYYLTIPTLNTQSTLSSISSFYNHFFASMFNCPNPKSVLKIVTQCWEITKLSCDKEC